MAGMPCQVYVDTNNYVYGYDLNAYGKILENNLQYIINYSIMSSYLSSDFYSASELQGLHALTEEEYNQIQAGTFPYGIPSVTSRDSSPVQPLLTYSINWGTNNVYQKLSGKTYIAPNGQTVDCSTITVTFSSSQHFKKFYATAVKDGNDYGFIDDVLVDIRQTNPTGILLHELTSRNANTDFTFTINTSSLTAGDGQYRIGLYVQNDDNIWNYEYFLVDVNNNPIVDSQENNLLVPVAVDFTYNSIPNNYYPLCADISNNIIFLFDPSSKTVINSYGCNLKGMGNAEWNDLQNSLFIYNNLCYIDVLIIQKYYTINYTITNYNDSSLQVVTNSGWLYVYNNSRIQNNVGPPISTVFPS